MVKPFRKKALERIVHLLVECILDTGNDMIDGFIMRDPGSYDDIMDILVDEKVVPTEEGTHLKNWSRVVKHLFSSTKKWFITICCRSSVR